MDFKHFFYPSVVYLLGLVLGFNIPPSPISDIFHERLSSVDYNGQSDSTNFSLVAENNIRVIFTNVIGAFSFGAISVLNTLYNGIILGYTISTMLNYFSLKDVMKHFLPHSLEVVAVIYSCGMGLVIANYLIKKYLLNKKPTVNTKGFGIHLITVVVITILSAYLEVYVSMKT